MVAAIDHSRASLEAARTLFTELELWRLMWVEATLAAEQYLVAADELPRPCRVPPAGFRSVASADWPRVG
jgi:hypothetical protein